MEAVSKWATRSEFLCQGEIGFAAVPLVAASRGEEGSAMIWCSYEDKKQRRWIPAFAGMTERRGALTPAPGSSLG